MKFSFAQNFEDVMLHRCFSNAPAGFYVDVGAAAPVAHSVTLNFYLRGWRGLHVEPLAERAEELRWCRPRDIVIEAAASDGEGGAIFNRTAGAGGLSSLSSEFLGAIGSRRDVWPIEVKTRTLRGILAENEVQDIDFLKIDVEGAEGKVIVGMDFRRWRPIVVLIEAVTPTQPPRLNFASWEPELIACGYAYVYFDGLNRYYLRNESLALRSNFDHPPCVFDPVSRFEDFGEPLLNAKHPDHEFAIRTAKILLRAFASGAREPLQFFTRDYAPAFLEEPASAAHAQWAIQQVLARAPHKGEIELLLAKRDATVRQMLEVLFSGDGFRTACGRAAV
jgi:FkbM family methyltransferase